MKRDQEAAKKDKAFYRSIELNRSALDEEKRELPVSFSSETEEVKRWFGIEILSHEPGAVDLSRLKRVGSHLFNHNPDRIIGPIRDIKLLDGKGYAILGYDETEEGELRLKQSKSGSLRGVSVFYDPIKMRKLGPGETYKLSTKEVKGREDIDVYVVTKWQPIEITSTPVPADADVGPGRGRNLDGIEIEQSKFNNKEEKQMDEKEVQAMIDKAFEKVPETLSGMVPEIVSQVRDTLADDAKPKMKIENDVFQDLLGRAGAVSLDLKSKVADMAVEGKTEQEITRAILDAAITNPNANDNGDLNDGTGLKKKKEGNDLARVTSFEGLDDDVFFRGLTESNDLPLQ